MWSPVHSRCHTSAPNHQERRSYTPSNHTPTSFSQRNCITPQKFAHFSVTSTCVGRHQRSTVIQWNMETSSKPRKATAFHFKCQILSLLILHPKMFDSPNVARPEGQSNCALFWGFQLFAWVQKFVCESLGEIVKKFLKLHTVRTYLFLQGCWAWHFTFAGILDCCLNCPIYFYRCCQKTHYPVKVWGSWQALSWTGFRKVFVRSFTQRRHRSPLLLSQSPV